MSKEQKLVITSGTLALMAIVGSIGVLYWVTTSLSIGALRAWAVATIFIIPLSIFAGWRLGTRDARAHLSGLDKGIDRVMGAASKTADLRTSTAGRVRQVTTVMPTSTLRLPNPEIVHVKPTSDEVVDL